MTEEEYEEALCLPAVEKIRAAEQMIRREHRVISDPDYKFWGNVADHLNMSALIPEKTGDKNSDWRAFNRAQDMATGYIEMSARLAGRKISQ